MLSEPTAILFETQLGWPPPEIVSFRVTKDLVRALYNKLHEAEFNDFAYQNLELQGSGFCLFTKHEEGGASRCRFGDGNVSITEEATTATVDDFVRRAKAVLRALAAVCADANVEPPPVLTQRCKINCLSQPHESESPIELLAKRLARVVDKIEPFGRPPAFFGVRFRFPPASFMEDGEDKSEQGKEDDSQTEDFSAVRFETYSEDQSKVWMEVSSNRFFQSLLDVSGDGLGEIESGIRTSYRFLTENCKDFLDQFDVKKQNEGDGGEE
jgi:hypothetical protein